MAPIVDFLCPIDLVCFGLVHVNIRNSVKGIERLGGHDPRAIVRVKTQEWQVQWSPAGDMRIENGHETQCPVSLQVYQTGVDAAQRHTAGRLAFLSVDHTRNLISKTLRIEF